MTHRHAGMGLMTAWGWRYPSKKRRRGRGSAGWGTRGKPTSLSGMSVPARVSVPFQGCRPEPTEYIQAATWKEWAERTFEASNGRDFPVRHLELFT